MSVLKYNWSHSEISTIFNQAFPNLIFEAQTVHREHFSPLELQRSTLLSIKTGLCPEDCGYCSQSAHHQTEIERHRLMAIEDVAAQARAAKESGSTRLCMGAAWREVKDGKDFDTVLEMVKEVTALGMEACCTLGMLTEDQARRLKEAGCHSYNHNLDTSPEYYPKVVSTRTYQDRIRTIKHVQNAGINLCCGGIIGMGEEEKDRIELLRQLANCDPHPSSVPINLLIPVAGTPLENEGDCDPLDFVRTIATARIIMPKSFVRLSAGRTKMSDEMQALCFLAGANSIFAGEKLLTAPNPEEDKDISLISRLGMSFMKAHPGQDEREEKLSANA
jgi:biotin synthase